MNKNIGMNAFFKVLTVVIIGYFVFELLFGIVTGNFGLYGAAGGDAHHADSKAGAGTYSFDMFINALLVLLIKLLVVIFFIVLIAGAMKWIKSIWSTEEVRSLTGADASKDLGSLLIVTGAVLGILVLMSIVSGFGKYQGIGLEIATSYVGVPHRGSGFFNEANLLEGFVDILMYITAVILGLEIFAYFQGRVSKKDDTR